MQMRKIEIEKIALKEIWYINYFLAIAASLRIASLSNLHMAHCSKSVMSWAPRSL